jgi:hypothetical protein
MNFDVLDFHWHGAIIIPYARRGYCRFGRFILRKKSRRRSQSVWTVDGCGSRSWECEYSGVVFWQVVGRKAVREEG